MAGSPWEVTNITHEKVLDENPNLHFKNAENALREGNISAALKHIGYAEQTANGRKEILEQCEEVKRLLIRKKKDSVRERAARAEARARAAEQERARAEAARIQAQEWYSLGLCYENGDGVPQDNQQAAEWYCKAAEQGNADAQFKLGLCYENGVGVPQDNQLAAKWYCKAAGQGKIDAKDKARVCCYNLGLCYKKGEGVPQDDRKAAGWFLKAAEQGHADAQNELGNCYYNGKGLKRNYQEAVKWYRKAAEQGVATAQFSLGNFYYNGKSLTRNYEEAVKWYLKAAEQGVAAAQFSLGSCYDNGTGVPQNYEEAAEWYFKAAEQGNVDAQYFLGHCYSKGCGVAKDMQEAIAWWSKAAELGRADAQYLLGLYYYNGDGVSRDNQKAAEWFYKAAEQGNADAQFHLGDCYRKGKGVRRDNQKAVEWYRKAAEQGNADAKDRLDKYDRRRRHNKALYYFAVCFLWLFIATLGIGGEWVSASLCILLSIWMKKSIESKKKPASLKHRIVLSFIFIVIVFANIVISSSLNDVLADYLWEKLLLLNGKLPEYLLRITSVYENLSDSFWNFALSNGILSDYLFKSKQMNSFSCCVGLAIAFVCEIGVLVFFNKLVSVLKEGVCLWKIDFFRNIFTKLLLFIRWVGMFILVGLSFIGGLLIQNIDLRNFQINFLGGSLF